MNSAFVDLGIRSYTLPNEDEIKLWVDDERPAPEGWFHVKDAHHAVYCLLNKKVTHISLDHDLGLSSLTGYDVICWIEQQAYFYPKNFSNLEISIHSANPVGVQRMRQTLEAILNRRNKNE